MNTDWRKYPFRLVHNDSALDFPVAEGLHADQESDTWFIAGELTGATGRSFAFLTIFNKNRPGGTVVADFYTMSLFDCDTGEYGTYTDYDMPPKNMQPGARQKMSMSAGYLDIHYESSAGPVVWTACRDDHGELRPYTYRVSLRGVDQAGQSMKLDLDVTPTRAPVPVGADTCDGKITCFGQDDTYSYFQTGMAMSGTLRWGDRHEDVSGSAGHIDRQWFPRYAGGGGTGRRPASQVARMAHDQPRQRRRHEHLAAVRPDGRQCAATIHRCDGELPRPGEGSGVRGGRRRHGEQLRPLA